MAEHTAADLEERAWATAQARAFLAPPAEARGAEAMRRREERRPPSRAVLVLAVVPLPGPPEARGVGREARGADGRQEGAALTGEEQRILRAFCLWLTQEGLAICRDVGAARWAPVSERTPALIAAFEAALRQEEEAGND